MAAKEAIKLFTEQWDEELEATSIFGAAIDPLRTQLERLVETAAEEIALWMDPETRDVDLSLIASTWEEISPYPLPAEFKWSRVAQNYARAITKYVKNDIARHDEARYQPRSAAELAHPFTRLDRLPRLQSASASKGPMDACD
jgi:hypothetical protein